MPPPPTLSATARALLAGAAGFGVASVAAVLALGQGPAAALGITAAFGLGLWLLRRRIELVSDHWPRRVALPPPGALLDLPPPETLLAMVALPGGRFWMGSGWSDWRRWADERPRHRVTLAPFRIARTPATRGQWRAVMAAAPSPWRREVPTAWARTGDDDLPATDVSWFDALAFCNALSLAEGLTPCYAGQGADWTCDWRANGYRLPSEAEWEYACRGGRQTPWYWGRWGFVARWHAWYAGNANGRPHPVARKRPNPFGLYDMAGNCWEWCWDRFGDYEAGAPENPVGSAQGGPRVLRGGSFDFGPWSLRSALRLGSEPEHRNDDVGFRCARSGAPALDDLTP